MATESSEQYDTSSQIVWTGPRVVIDPVIVTDLETEYCNVANDFLAFTEKAGDKFTRDTNRIRRLILVKEKYRLISKKARAHVRELKATIKGLEHTNSVHLATIEQQAARIKELENDTEQLKIRVRDDNGHIESLAAQLKALTAPDSGVQMQPAESEPVVRKVAQSLTDSS